VANALVVLSVPKTKADENRCYSERDYDLTVVLTPHLGYVTAENYREAYGQAVEDVRSFLAGSPIRVLAVE